MFDGGEGDLALELGFCRILISSRKAGREGTFVEFVALAESFDEDRGSALYLKLEGIANGGAPFNADLSVFANFI